MLFVVLPLVLLFMLALGLQVFMAAPARGANRAYAAFTWMMALWVLNDLVFWGFHGPDADAASWAGRAFLLALGLQGCYLAFAWLFPEPRPFPRRALVVLGLVFAPVIPIVASGAVLGPTGFTDGHFTLTLTPWTFVIGAYVNALFVMSQLILRKKRRLTSDDVLKRQLDVAVRGPIVTNLAVSSIVMALPLLGIIDLLPYASFALLPGTIYYGHAVVRRRFLSPRSVLDRLRIVPLTAKLSLAISACTLITTAVVLAATAATYRNDDQTGWTEVAVTALLAASLPAMGLVLYVQRAVARPLRQLSEAALAVAGGRTDLRLPLAPRDDARGDELTVLHAAFNDMVERLDKDLIALREMTEGIVRAERLATAGALASGIAHEVNNPLAAVSSIVQMVREATTDAATKDLLATAIEQMERVAGVLQDLLDVSRTRPAERAATDINEVVSATLRLLRYDRRFRATPVAASLEAGLPPLAADRARLQQVLVNLLLNARDAVEGDGLIEVTTAHVANELVIGVSDSGKGIATDDLAHVFEPFFTTKPSGLGTGLGLAVCRDIVREHGGTITIESTPGRTRVQVTLPIDIP